MSLSTTSTCAQPQKALEVKGRNIPLFHLGKRGNRAAHRPHGADLLIILELVDNPLPLRSDHLVYISHTIWMHKVDGVSSNGYCCHTIPNFHERHSYGHQLGQLVFRSRE